MTSWDYFVGFEREPQDLDAFLQAQGYLPTPSEPDTDSSRHYESREESGLVDLFYFSECFKVREGEVPNWREAGYNVTSELMISTKDVKAEEEASRLANVTVRKYNGILYDPNSDEFFRSEDL